MNSVVGASHFFLPVFYQVFFVPLAMSDTQSEAAKSHSSSRTLAEWVEWAAQRGYQGIEEPADAAPGKV